MQSVATETDEEAEEDRTCIYGEEPAARTLMYTSSPGLDTSAYVPRFQWGGSAPATRAALPTSSTPAPAPQASSPRIRPPEALALVPNQRLRTLDGVEVRVAARAPAPERSGWRPMMAVLGIMGLAGGSGFVLSQVDRTARPPLGARAVPAAAPVTVPFRTAPNLPRAAVAQVQPVTTRADAPAPPRDGGLWITTAPVTDVFVDGRRMGRAPLLVRPLSPGQHHVRISSRETGVLRRDVWVAEGRTRGLDLTLQTGTLAVRATAGTEIFVNGKLAGVAPIAPVELFEGAHELELRRGSARWSTRVTVQSGLPQVVEHAMR